MEQNERYLETQKLQEVLSPSIASCSLQCLFFDKCKSTNFQKQPNSNGLHICELLEKTYEDNTVDLKVSPEWIHYHGVSAVST